jgi:hypothetical protein
MENMNTHQKYMLSLEIVSERLTILRGYIKHQKTYGMVNTDNPEEFRFGYLNQLDGSYSKPDCIEAMIQDEPGKYLPANLLNDLYRALLNLT